MAESGNDKRITIEREARPVNVKFHGAVLASTEKALILRETGYDPVYYIPKDRVEMGFLRESEKTTTCPHKGDARYWSISAEGQAADDAVWAYDEPRQGVEEIGNHVAFDSRAVSIEVG